MMSKRRLTAAAWAVFLLGAGVSKVGAQAADPDLYELYNSSSTDHDDKRILGRMIRMQEKRAEFERRNPGQSRGGIAPLQAGAGAAVPAAAASAADAAFGLRQVYAFPNPARRQEKPTVRVQVGIADSVDIKIYDVSGQLVHSAGLNAPQVLDDGNGKGPQWTYDYSWDTSGIGSGVYTYLVTAKKAGQADIRQIKKVAILK